jgi:hypothetical protein
MAAKESNRPADLERGQPTRRGLKEVNDIMQTGASVNDRVVTNPDPEEQEPKQLRTKPIVSINGEDVNPTQEHERKKRPAA